MTLLDLFAHAVGRVSDRSAMVFRERRLTYQALDAEARRLAAVLRLAGTQPGDRAILVCPNLPEFGIGYLGALMAGATVVPLNPLLKTEEVRYILEDSGATAMVCLQSSLPVLRAARSGMARRVPIVLLDAPTEAGSDDFSLPAAPEGMPGPDAPALGTDDVAVCLYTSGTTGRPKGALLTHRNLIANLESFRAVLHVTEEDVFLAVLPLFHAYGATVLFLEPLSLGATIVVEPRFAPDVILRAIAQHRVSLFAGVPSMYAVLAATPRPPGDFSRWRLCISGGAPLPPTVVNAFEAAHGTPIYEGYGPTECAPVLTVNPPFGTRKVGSVGPPIPQVELQVVDDRGDPVPPGAVGEIVARGPNVMRGYLNRPAETAEAMRGGWYHTGDLGRVDEDGYYYIVDRKTDLILVGGLNVYPSEIERVLCDHPHVAEAAVIGVPDPIRGEAPKAFVIPRDGREIGAQDLLQWCRQRLANYKVPRSIVVVPDLPRTVTGKILKSEIRSAPECSPLGSTVRDESGVAGVP
jgi:long-chain acyl-CoA synthetase